jgi:hypothetical protein
MKNERYFFVFARDEGEICKDMREYLTDLFLHFLERVTIRWSIYVANGIRLVFYMHVRFQIKCLARFALN